MASLLSAEGDLQLDLRLLGTTLDPFQQDLEWFEYAVSVDAGNGHVDAPTEAAAKPTLQTHARGKINRKELEDLLRGMEDLAENSQSMRFEPADLKFYFEWTHETPSVFLIIVWFDLPTPARNLQQRFPMAHVGYRFLSDRDSLRRFCKQVAGEFRPQRKSASIV